MKKWLLGAMAVLMAVSLAACTPTTEKQKKESTAASAKSAEEIVPPSTGGASDKVPDPNVKPVAIISVYHGDNGTLIQDMDSLDVEGLDAQLLVDKLVEFGVLTEGTEVLNFDIEGEGEEAVGTLDLNKAESGEGCSDEMFLTEIGNTFTDNFELLKLKLQVNGADYDGEAAPADGYQTYNADYESVE